MPPMLLAVTRFSDFQDNGNVCQSETVLTKTEILNGGETGAARANPDQLCE